MKKILLTACLGLCLAGAVGAQSMSTTTTTTANDKDGKPLPSPRMLTSATVGKAAIEISYGAPSLRGRDLATVVPAGKIWRAGANEATSLKTTGNLMIGSLHIPAGSYTLYIAPAASGWTLAVNKQTGQWGTVYNQPQDLGRTPMKIGQAGAAQETLSIDLEKIAGGKAELHVKWGTTDASVMVMSH